MQLNKTKKQVIVLYFSTIIGVVIGVFNSMINTDALPPAEYGNVRYVVILMGFFSGIFLVGYFVSGARLLALSKTEEKTRQIKGVLVCILGFMSLLMMVTMLICGIIHEYILHKDGAELFFYSLPICAAPLMLSYVNTSSQGDNSIYMIAATRLLPSLTYMVIAYLIYKYVAATSIIMLLLQNGLQVLIIGILIYLNAPLFKNLKQTFKELHKENKEYGLQVYYGSLVGVAVPYIAGITLGLFSEDNSNVGFYSLALTVTSPLQMLPNVIGTTYFKQFANQSRIDKKVLISTFAMTGLTLVAFIVLIFPLVDIIYNESYHIVAIYAAILAAGASIHGIGDMYNRFLGAHGKGTYLRNGAFATGAVSFIGFTLGVYIWGINGALVTRLLSGFVYFFMMWWYYQKMKQ